MNAALAAQGDYLDLARLRDSVAPFAGALRIELDPAERAGWIGQDHLADPDTGPLADLHGRLVAAGFGATRRAAAASLLLRYGWAAGFQIAAWLRHGAVVHLDRFALNFSPSTLVEGVWAQEARVEWPVDAAAGRAALLASLRAFSEPLVESQHRWSRFSRHALWSMIVSSWAGQFTAIGGRLGRADAADEARLVFGHDAEITRAIPQLYTVTSGARSRDCQIRAACCLYYKGPARHFCVSCPIIPKDERLMRNRDFSGLSG